MQVALTRVGKSTFIKALRAMLGKTPTGYAGVAPSEMLLVKPFGDGVPNGVAQLKGARFVTASETEAGKQFAEAKVNN